MKKFCISILFLLFPLLGMAQLDVVKFSINGGLSDALLTQKIENNTSRLLSIMNSTVIAGKNHLKFEKGDEEVFTKDGKRIIEELWETSAMICPISNVAEKCITLKGGASLQVRNIPVTILAANDDESEQELVISFTLGGLIDNITIALEENRYVDIINAHIEVKELYRRQSIIDFVENFRTAYNRKDIDYINNVFSNNALIITGKVVKVKNRQIDMAMQSLTKEEIQYQKSTKEEYITNLKKCFKNNSYINLSFDDIEVIRHPKHPDIFGVTLKQHWNSSNYSDVGYLFMMINFEDELNPCIQVRTWQPEKYNGKALSRDEIFSLDKFSI